MEKITINIGNENFEFASEILMRHLRKIQPLNKRMEIGEITELDFFIELSLILCNSENSNILEEKINNLNISEIEEFTKAFEPVLQNLNNFNKKTIEEKKR